MDFGLIDKKAIIPASSRGLGKPALGHANEESKYSLTEYKNLEKTVKEFTQDGFMSTMS